jgi:hypothetical protein
MRLLCNRWFVSPGQWEKMIVLAATIGYMINRLSSIPFSTKSFTLVLHEGRDNHYFGHYPGCTRYG